MLHHLMSVHLFLVCCFLSITIPSQHSYSLAKTQLNTIIYALIRMYRRICTDDYATFCTSYYINHTRRFRSVCLQVAIAEINKSRELVIIFVIICKKRMCISSYLSRLYCERQCCDIQRTSHDAACSLDYLGANDNKVTARKHTGGYQR